MPGLELNVASFLRLGVGASYRWAAYVDYAWAARPGRGRSTGEVALRPGRF